MIKSANQYPISSIYDIETKLQYRIPRYQREYAWGKQEWEFLLDDLTDNDEGYFLGSIICVNEGRDALAITPLEVIDGQQRLATISLLYASIYERLAQETRTDEDFITERSNLKYRLIQKGTTRGLRLELSHQNKNNDDYKAILNELDLYSDPGFSKPPNLGNRRLYRAYQHFRRHLSEATYEELMEMLRKINSALVVKIEVDNHADAYTLFESLNNRGIPLSAMDLVKNKMLSTLEKTGAKPIDEAYDNWVKLIENLPDYSVQERFLRQYYNAFLYDSKIKVKGISRATKSSLIRIFDALISKDAKYIFDELTSKAKTYNLFVDPPMDSAYANDLWDLLHIEGAPAYTLLLYLFSEFADDEEMLRETINFLVKYFVRRNLTDFPETRMLDSMFMDLIDSYASSGKSPTVKRIRDYLTKAERFADIDLFREKLKGDIYDTNAAVARFVLCKIEEKHKTKEKFVNLWEQDKNGKYLWTIEHIFPEGEKIPGPWVEMIASGSREKAEALQEKWVHKLGNLTLTGYNPTLSNLPFEKKRDRTSAGEYVGYKNGLYLNKKLSKKSKWSIPDIKTRTDELVQEALDLFALPNEYQAGS